MKLRRNLTRRIGFILDECLPPYLRDREWLMRPALRLLFGDKAKHYLAFKDDGLELSEEQFRGVYEETSSVRIQRETDLNEECIRAIQEQIAGESVLEVGCGRGLLSNILSQQFRVTAVDMAVSPDLVARYPQIKFQEANLQALPFEDQQFDTVISTHTLEHVQDIFGAIKELRRVAGKRVIVVVPRQRPYRFTFDLHLHFFPYKYSLLAIFVPTEGTTRRVTREIGGDWYYQEDRS